MDVALKSKACASMLTVSAKPAAKASAVRFAIKYPHSRFCSTTGEHRVGVVRCMRCPPARARLLPRAHILQKACHRSDCGPGDVPSPQDRVLHRREPKLFDAATVAAPAVIRSWRSHALRGIGLRLSLPRRIEYNSSENRPVLLLLLATLSQKRPLAALTRSGRVADRTCGRDGHGVCEGPEGHGRQRPPGGYGASRTGRS